MRGVVITKEALEQVPAVRVSAEGDDDRLLRFSSPMMTGEDVAEVQRALKQAGFNLAPDGIFGRNTEATVRRFQEQEGLTPDGIVGQATRAALGI